MINGLLIDITIFIITMRYEDMTFHAQSMNMLEANIPTNILDTISYVTITSSVPIHWKSSYLRRLHRLQGITIMNSELHNIDQLPDVEEIVLKGMNLRQFPNVLLERPNLKWLDVTDNDIQRLNISSNNNTLIGLDISSNMLRSLNGIEMLINLEFLHALDNQIAVIDNLYQLSYLDLSENQITSLIIEDDNYRLKTLIINDNKLSFLDYIDRLHVLETFNATMNRILSMEQVSTLITHDRLINIDLSHNNINYIDPLIISNSTRINLSYNQLSYSSFYSGIRHNIDIVKDDILFSLMLNDNRIEDFPEYILDFDIELHIRVDDSLIDEVSTLIDIRHDDGLIPLTIDYSAYINIFPTPSFNEDDPRYNEYALSYIFS